MTEPARPELKPFADRIARLRYRAVREKNGRPDLTVWSFALIEDLRAREEIGGRERAG
ncbi:MAG TPA: hypothetical protein VFX98_00055 [Longimicrobiaceae bacterium]|nr:hypothetical protein [Longimicrobiaceae bacterium]